MSTNDTAHGATHLNQPASTNSNNSGAKLSDLSLSSITPPVKSLTYEELVAVCQALGGSPPRRTPDTSISNSTATSNPASSVDEKHLSVGTQQDDEEKQLKSTTTVPPPYGLYKRVVDKRKSSWWKYQTLAFVYNACLVMQLLLGATLTALGASDKKKSVTITIIAALNTCVTSIFFFFLYLGPG
jgi:hypothetical protein